MKAFTLLTFCLAVQVMGFVDDLQPYRLTLDGAMPLQIPSTFGPKPQASQKEKDGLSDLMRAHLRVVSFTHHLRIDINDLKAGKQQMTFENSKTGFRPQLNEIADTLRRDLRTLRALAPKAANQSGPNRAIAEAERVLSEYDGMFATK